MFDVEWFKKTQENVAQESQNCLCKRGGVSLEKRQLSRLLALFFLVLCFAFLGGYFWGQKVATDQLLNVVERDSFADQIYYSMCSMYDLKDDESNGPDVVSGEEEEDPGINEQQTNIPSGAVAQTKAEPAPTTYAPVVKATKQYKAQLAGFGSLNAAQQLVSRLQKKNIKVLIDKRQSRTVKGKGVNWYQVVTPPHASKDGLNTVVANIKKVEKLHDVRIVEVGVS